MKVRAIKCLNSCTNNKCNSNAQDITKEGYDGLQYHEQHQKKQKRKDSSEVGSTI